MTEDQVAFYIVMGILALIVGIVGYQAYPRKRWGPPDA